MHPVYEIENIERDRWAPQSLDDIAIVKKDHPMGYQIGDLTTARDRFTKLYDVDTDWGAEPDD
jgi:hypothetical protein